MQHIAIDLGGKKSQICVRSETGEILEERSCVTRLLGRYLGKAPQSRVIVETCTEAFAVADEALEAGHQVRVVPATLVRSLGVGARGIKTDQRDAQVLSEVSCRIDLPSVHVPSHRSRELKAMCGMREELIGARTKLINNVRGWLRARHLRPRSGITHTFASRVRALACELPTYVERQLICIETLSEQVRAADAELREIAASEPLYRRLMTIPGIGPVTAVRFVAALDEISRFPDAHRVQSYLGLVPGENSSSTRKRRTSLTKAGPAPLRRALLQAAWAVRRTQHTKPIGRWALAVEQRRGKFIAVTALARKLAGILYALWRDASTYQASKAARALTT